MPKYIYNGKEFSADEVFAAAEQKGLSIDQYIIDYGIDVVEDPMEIASFQTGPVEETVAAGPQKIETVNMESMPESGLSVLPEVDKPTAWQSIKNSFSNLGEQIGDIFEFWGADEGAGSALDIATHAVYETIFGRENIEKFIEFAGEDSFWTRGLSVKETKTAIDKFEKEKEETKQTLGIIESLKQGDMAGVAAGIINGVTNGIGSVAYMFGTGGAGFAADYVADSYVEYNKIKAENEGKSLKQLIDDGEASNAVPVAMGAVMTGLERIGFGAISKGVKGAVKGSGGQTIIGGLSKDIAEKVFYNKGARATANIISTGATEFTTEVLQNAAEAVNKELGSIAGTEREGKILDNTLDIGKTFVDAVFSEEALEAGLQGAFGGGGMVAGSYSAKAMSTVRKVVSQVDVTEDLNKLANKRKELAQATTNLAKEGIQSEIDQIEMKISDAVQQGNVIYDSLTNEQISEIENLTDLADAAAYKVTQLNKQFRRGEISEEIYNSALQGFKNQYDQARQGLIDMKLNENIKLAQEQGKQKGIDVEVVETDEAFKNKIKEITGEELESKTKSGQNILTQGVYLGDGKILINKEVARKTGAISVGTHELLHPILNSLVGDVKQQNKIVKEFRKSMTYDQKRVVDNLMKQRGYTTPQQYATEYITTFSDALANGQINYEKNVFEKIGDAIIGIFKPLGYDNISFESGRDVYNFIKEYNKSIEKGVVSEKVTKAISGLDITKEQDQDIQESRQLGPEISKADLKSEIDTFVQKEGVKKYNTKEEFQLSEDYINAYTKLAETNLLDGSILGIIRRDDTLPTDPNVQAEIIRKTKENVSERFLKNFDPAKNESLFGWLLGANPIVDKAVLDVKKEYAKTPQGKSLDIPATEGGVREIIAEDTDFDVAIDEGIERKRAEAKLINPVNLIENESLRKKYTDTVVSKIKDLEGKKLSFKSLKDLAPEIIAEVFDIPVKKVTDPKANLASGDISAIQNFINKNADALLKLLPDGGITYGQAASESLLGTSTGVPKKLLDAFYDPLPRETKGAGLKVQKKKKGITRKEFLKTFGVVDGKKIPGLSPRGPEAQAMKGMISLLGRMMTNTIVRQELSKQPGKEALVQDIAAGKSELQFSRTLAGEMSSEKGNIFWNLNNIKAFKDLIINDPKNIGNHFKEIYSGVFENEEKIAKELNTEYKNWEKLDADKKDNVEEHMINFITSFGLRAGLRNILGLGNNSLNFRNKKQLESARKGLQELVKNISEEDFMKYLLPTLQSGWGLIGGKFVAEKNSDGYILTEVNEDGSKSFRYHLVSGRNDAINVLLQGVFDNETSYTPRSTEAIINGKKIKTTVVPDQTANSFVDGKFEKDLKKRQDFAKDQKNGMLKISETLQRLLNDGTINANDVGMILMTFASNTNALIRTAAVPENKFDGEFSENTEFVYEHSKPAREILIQIADLIGNNKLNKKTYNNIMKDYVVTILPKVYDDIINKYYKDFLPIDKDGNYLKSTAQRPSRYFNDLVEAEIAAAGLPPLKLTPLGKKTKRKIVLQPSQTLTGKEKILDTQFNNILEKKTGIASEKEYSEAKAKVVGASKGKFNWFIPPTAEDFVGLLYQFLGKGKIGDAQMAWFKVNLLDPYAKAMSKISRDRNSVARNYRALKKELKIVPKNLKKEVPGEGFTKEQAVRVYIWTKQGYEIPGLNKTDAAALRKFINSDKQLKEFADKLILLNKGDYAKPKTGWTAGTITTDLLESLNTGRRAEYLADWQANVDVIFSEKNLNKIEAAYGSSFRYALENILTRMKTGRNRTYGTDSLTGRVTDWLTNSIGAIMFFNTRSAILQTISAVNFINFGDNNLLAAGKAFTNQKQYWSDFLKLYNSDFLVDRRDGLRLNVNESDIADMAKKGGVRGVISELLKLGFTPTQIADSFAIASGGSTFYRNRVNTYLKEGLDQKAAEEKAFQDFRETAEESQQSSRPDKISAQQAGPLGRIILAFANTPAQYARLMKKAYLDLKDGRGDAKTNISKLIYYGAVQNLVFNAMQQALFGLMFGDEEEDDEKKEKKAIDIANGMADSILRGMGISGAIVSVLKNTAKKLIEQSEKREPKYAENALGELLKISPPISSKASKIKNALRSYEWDKDEMYEKGFALENPAYLAAGNIISASTNIPLDRAVKKVTNVKDAMDEDLQLWQRIALLSGWSDWEIGINKKDKQKTKSKKSSKSTKLGRNTKL